MTSSPSDDLGAAMARLLDQELTASARATAPAAPPDPEPVAESEDEGDGEEDTAAADRRLEDDVLRIAATALRIPEQDLDPTENLATFGVDSIAITEIMASISRAFGISVAPTTFFEARDLDDLARILRSRHAKAIDAHYAAQESPPAPEPPPAPEAAPSPHPAAAADAAPEAWLARHRRLRTPAKPAPASKPKPAPAEASDAPVAIISMDGRFPQSPDLETFEAHLRAGDDCMEEVPADRWDWRAVHGDPRKGRFTDVRFGGFVPEVDAFDAGFFRIAPREAELMDPQHRLFMECVWSLIEKAGHAPGSLSGRKVGLFLGINLLDYTEMVNRAGIMEAQQLTGLGHAFCPNRLSFLLDVHGPSQVVDTACSSSLVALHRAVMSIRHEGCEMAIAGGSNLMLSPMQHIMFSKVGMIAPDGRCKTFSSRADGYGRSDGVGAVLLKRRDLAERDGDPILGVIRASVEHHGGTATSLTAPNPKAQARLIVEAHRTAGIDPRTVGLIECHGTGTPLGDPVEVEGLKAAFAELYADHGLPAPQTPHIGLGSVKSNIGHTETAAGVAGLIKVLLALRHGTLYRTLHCEDANPLLALDGSPFYLLTAPRPWERPRVDGVEQPRRAGLSSFGAGGTNVHVVVEEYRAPASAATVPAEPLPAPVVVPVSAREDAALRAVVTRLKESAATAPLADLAYTLQVGRDAMRRRVAFLARDRAELARAMDAWLAGQGGDGVFTGDQARGRREHEPLVDASGLTPQEIAARWVAGADMDWSRLHQGARRRRLELPSYAFQRRRYWLPLPEAETAAPGAAPFTMRLTGDEFFLADHRVQGRPVLPGVAYLEVMRKAAAGAGIADPVLTRVVWLKPLPVTASVTLEVALSEAGDGVRRAEVFSISADGTRDLHAQAQVSAGRPEPASPMDLTALEARCATRIPAERVYAAFDGMGLSYGPGHRAITALATADRADGGREVFARLRLPEAVTGTDGDFVLHPSLMDGAFQAAVGMVLEADGSAPSGAALPFAIDAVEVLGPCCPDMAVHVRPAAGARDSGRVRTLDLDVMAADGSLRVRLRGFATREAAPRSPVLRFIPQPRPATGTGAAPASRLVLLCGGTVAPEALPDTTVRALDDAPAADLATRYTRLATALLAEVKALPAGAPMLVQLVVPDGPEAAALAGLGGLLRSAALEQPDLSAQVVTAAAALDGTVLAERLRAAVGAGARVTADAAGVTSEGWAEAAPAAAPAPWRNDGVYLVTGGAGGIGRLLTAAILEAAPGAAVALVNRSPLDAEGQTWLAGLGSDRVSHHAVDLSDAEAVVALVADVRRRHGRLDGILHAAGLVRDEALPRKTPEQLAEVLAPKVTGTVNLDRAVGAEPLDLFVLFSSVSGVFGNVGQADYAAANAFLDGFAEAREARRRAGACHGRTVSIAWPLWRDGGMRMDAASQALMTRTTGLVPLETADGLAALHDALAGEAARMVVLPGDADRLRRWMIQGAPAPRTEPAKPAAAPTDVGALQARVLAAVTQVAAGQLKVAADDLEPDVELTEYGFDSIGFTQFANVLNDRFDLGLTPTLFFEHPTLDMLAAHLAEAETEAMAAVLGTPAPRPAAPAPAPEPAAPAPAPAPVVRSAPAPEPARPQAGTAVAIIGMSGQFPGAPDVDTFWRNLAEGRDGIGEVPADRWDWQAVAAAAPEDAARGTVRWGGFIEGIAAFDAAFFGISPPEARMMDPQQRLLLTQAWRVMEDAGQAPRSLSGSRTGVFLGIADTGYGRLIAAAGAGVEGYAMTGLAPSLGPNRISYYFNLNGPSVAVETACSSALVAVHRAVEAIASGACEAAIAGGINTLLLPDSFIGFSKAGMLSPGGRCKPFSAAADGYARGEGLGLVFLKPLADAERDGDRILAVIRASAENHGGRAGSLTAPNPRAQAELLRTAYRKAGFDPRTVSYIEAHGTGTPLGDPIEVEALTTAFTDLAREAEAVHGPAPKVRRGLGSVKSNIGHLEIAAGAAGLIKVVQQMRHGTLAATLHCDRLNPYLALEGSGFDVVRKTAPWDRPVDADGRPLPRRAGVSSFGFGGSNAHVVLEEYIPPEAPSAPAGADGPQLIVLSARSEERLTESARRLRDAVAALGEAVPLADIAYTLQVARDGMAHRLGFVVHDRADVLARLDAFATGREDPAVHVGSVKAGRAAIAILESDPELKRGIAGLVERGRPDGLLELWVRGLEVDWRALHGAARRRRVPLPGYPFAETAYWVPTAAPAPAPAPTSAPVSRTESVFDGREYFLRDHVVGGRPVLPGVMQLEMVRAALGAEAFELHNHVWLRPVVVDGAPQRLRVDQTPAGPDAIDYRIAGTEAHGQGRAHAVAPRPVAALDLDALTAQAPQAVAPDALYDRFAAMGMAYGPAHRAITDLRTGPGLVVARLDLPQAAQDAARALNPALLDGALQAVVALVPETGGAPALPYAVRRIAVFGPTERRMWAVVRPDGADHAIDLCTEDGSVRVRLEGFAARRPQRPATAPASAPTPAPPVADEAAQVEHALSALLDIAARVLEVEPSVLDVDTELGEFGFDSITMTAFASKVNAELDLSLTPADFFEFATLARLAAHIAPDLALPQAAEAPAPEPSPVPIAAPVPVQAEPPSDDPVVIVGYSARFPGAPDADAFWRVLADGRDCISRIPADRWDWRAHDGDPRTETGKTNIHWGGFIDGVFQFDPLFFNISPREARLMDPQQRLLMMHAWNAVEAAGHDPRGLAGRRVGLFVGTSSSGYRDIIGDDTGGEGYVATGAVPSVGPNRLSYFLDLHGPSEPVETACSSSLVAIHRAVQSIRAGDCEMALVGGVNTIVTPEAHVNFAKAGMLSPDGRCKTFSSKANGYVRGEGVGMLFLKRLSQAERDGDPIHAVIRGTAINHGGRANSLTAPNTAAQADLLRDAYRRAGIDPRTVGYIEAHGTGTALGDPVEINALKAAFRDLTAEAPAEALEGAGCGLGSVKTNIGHLELAAGVAGVVKVLLQMRHGTLAPSLHCDDINPYIDLTGSPFEIVREQRPWAPVRDAAGREVPRRAGVSSFGFGGVNAHVVLEEYRPSHPLVPSPVQGPVVAVLSARDEARLRDRVRDLVAALDAGRVAEADLGDLAYTLQVGRTPLKQRLAVVVGSVRALRDRLAAWLEGDTSGILTGKAGEGSAATVPDTGTDPQALAAHWVAGGAVDWAALHDGPRRRLPLPGYPFAPEEYHIARAVPARTGAVALAAPQPAVSAPAPGVVRLEADAFYLRDHQVRGQRVLPGAMGLELARAACGRDAPVRLSRIVWRRPLVLDAGTAEVTVAVAPEGAFALRGPDGTEHMTGEAAPGPPEPAPRLDLKALKAACGRTLDPDWLYAAYAALGLDYGPAFRAVRSLAAGEGAVLARLALPQAARNEGMDFVVHPSLLDAAFHAALGLFASDAAGDGEGRAALPFAVDCVDVFGPTTDTMWAQVRDRSGSGDTRRLDIDLADAEGVVRVAVRGFALRLLDRAPAAETAPARLPADGLRAAAETYFKELVAREAAMPAAEVALDAALEEYGIDSILIVRLTEELEKVFGPLPKTLFFDHQTLAGIVDHVLATHPETLAATVGQAPAAPPAPLAPEPAAARPAAAPAPAINEPVAIIGLAGRYPQAPDLDAFWRVLAEGRDCITEIPADRWERDRPTGANGRWGGFLEGVDRFDPLFFNISPREADYMDPQERLFLQTAWEALEDAGLTRATVAPAAPPLTGGDVGVFVGVMYEDYQLYGAENTAAGRPMALGGSAATIANRVSYFCGFHGPSLAVDTMCSSSLTAIHLACESLRSGSCSVALAGGVNLTLHPNKYLALGQGRFLSSKGRCESFGEGGDGYVPGEGVGAVLLKPLSRAIADGDRIHGVIRGSALNHGGKTNGYTVPNPAAQAAVIGRALAAAGVAPRDIGYVEAHGTGTSLGDPIEIAALGRAWDGVPAGGCAIGSVKSNVGHCESAAGMAGLTKVLLQFRHGQLAPSLHAETLNPNIDFAASPFRVQRRLEPWARPERGARLAALSSFGAGGSNAHLIVEEYVAPQPVPVAAFPGVYPVSARDPERLHEAVRRLRATVAGLDEAAMPGVARTLQDGREAFEERLAVVAPDRAGLLRALDDVVGGRTDGAGIHRGRASRTAPPCTDASDPDAVALAWVAGAAVSWRGLWGDTPLPPRIGLPTYPFARDRHWVPGATIAPEVPAPAVPLLFTPDWREASAAPGDAPARAVVVLCEMPEAAAQELSGSGVEVVALPADDRPPAARFTDHAARLLACLKAVGRERPASAVVQVVVPAGTSLMEGLSGMLRCARLEMPSVLCQLVTVEPAAPGLAARLAADRAAAKTDADVRHVGGRRLVRRWREIAPEAAPARPWKDGGVYLITGGAGGLGRVLAEDIAERADRPVLWLTGRSEPGEDLRAWMEVLPAPVEYRPVDVTDGAAVAALVGEITARHGRLDGVVHAAGIVRDSLIAHKREADLRAVLAPKVEGVAALDAATAHLDLDVMLLFASAAGAVGNPGQGDYAAANAWLDAFAAARNAAVAGGTRRGRTLALDWPYWAEGGMRLDAATIAAMEREAGVRPLETAAALRALDAALAAAGADQVLVLDGDPDRLRRLLDPVEDEPAPPPAPPVPDADRRQRVMAQVAAGFSEVLKIPAERLDTGATIDRFGVDSVSALEIVDALERDFGPLPGTILFEHPTLERLADALLAQAPEPVATTPATPEPETEAEPRPAPPAPDNAVAVIAVAGRFPGADTVEEFWTVLEEGRDVVTEVPAERWDHAPFYAEGKGRPGRTACKWGGFIRDVDRFDTGFFGYTPREAALSDPQERLFLETTWHLLERAGHPRPLLRRRYDGQVGVFVGAMYQQYHAFAPDADSRALLSLASYSAIVNRTSFFFDLQGPSVAVDSMCSSGLQAVHQACQSLRLGECRLAIAGGVNLSLHPDKYLGLGRSGLAGSSADSRSFAAGDGYLPAEGVGAVLLKPLADALRDGDPVLGVIRGSVANHGGHSAGYAVPNADAQARLIEGNLRRSGVDPRSIGYVEAAANGSPLGDAIEVRALTRAFRAFTDDEGFCAIGSVKTNMGHAEAASGMAQLTKVLLMLEKRRLVPSVPAGAPGNADVSFVGTPFVPQASAADWSRRVVDGVEQPRRATVSAFGAGGSNVHLILEEAPEAAAPAATTETDRPRRFPVSARTPEQLEAVRRSLAAFVRATPDLSLARLSWTLRTGREPLDCRLDILARTRDDLLHALETAEPGIADPAADAPEDPAGPPLILPPYPFARERHWLDGAPAVAAPVPEAPGAQAPLAVITGVLAAELGVAEDAIDAAADFAALGLESMAAMRLIHAVEEATGVVLGHRDLERHPTPARLARYVEADAAGAPTAAPEPVARPAGPWRCALTENQKGLWVLQSLYPRSGVYNVPMAFRLRGVGLRALERAVTWLLDRFPILTARVVDGDGAEPLLVAGPVEAPVKRVAVPKDMDPVDVARQRAARPFALATEPPSRFDLLHGGPLDEDEAILLVTLHHIACDGTAAAVVAHALWHACGRFAAGDRPEEPEGAADYTAFAAWERDVLDSPRGAAQRRYWLDRLAAAPAALDLPADRPARPDGAVDGRSQERVLSATRATAARRAAADLGITPAALFLGVLAAMLYRTTGAGDMVIGVPTLRRPGRRFAGTVGYCANMIALRLEVSGAQPADALLRCVQARLTEGLDHADHPFSAIARDLAGPAPGQPPYQVSFAYQNFPRDAWGTASAADAGRVEHLPQVRQVGDGAFGLEVHEEGEALRLVAGYDAARFEPATVARLLEHFVTLLDGVCAGAAGPVAALPLLSEAERARLVDAWGNGGPAPRRKGLVHEWIARQAKATPHAVAVEAEDERLTYRALVRRANRLARHLRETGVRPGDPVAVLLGREVRSVVAQLAVLRAGGVWVPLDPESPDARLGLILAECGARALVAAGDAAARVATLAGALPVVDLDRDHKAIRRQPARKPRLRLSPDAPAYMIHTSGTTGTPKGVVVPHGALAEHCLVAADRYALTRDDVVLQFAAHAVDTAVEQILPTLAVGARLVLRTGPLWMPGAFLRVLAERGITVADLPPAYLREVLLAGADDAGDLPLRLCLVGGEALTPDVVRLWRTGPLTGARLLNAYGPTEATVTALVHEVEAEAAEGTAVPIGRPLPGTLAVILDQDGNPVPEGAVGELHIGGRRLALGYHGRPDLTAERFVTRVLAPDGEPVRLYRTGDLASFVPGREGLVAFHGRVDHQVKVRGFRIEPGEIEAALEASGLRAAAVVPADGELVAYVVPGAAGFDEAAVRAFLAARLPAPMLPALYMPLDALPVTPAGKLDRAALPAPERRPAEAVAPRDAREARVHAVWAEVLGRADLGVEDDFAACGGHSLLAVRLLHALERTFGRALSIADLVAAPTIAAQARLLRDTVEPGAAGALPPTLVPLRRPAEGGDDRPPLFLMHPVSGAATCYAPLAARLAEDVTVYGIQAVGTAPESLEAMAQGYLADVRRVQPRGPYCLGGWSLGGVVAFEMARLLKEQGEAVAFLGLIDSVTPQALERLGLAEAAAGTVDQDVQAVLAASGAATDAALRDRLRATAEAHGRLFRAHRPRPCEAPAVLLRAAEGPAAADASGWRELALGGLSVTTVPGDHYGVLASPGLEACAAAINAALATAFEALEAGKFQAPVP